MRTSPQGGIDLVKEPITDKNAKIVFVERSDDEETPNVPDATRRHDGSTAELGWMGNEEFFAH